MTKIILDFSDFSKLFEGGSAIEKSRRIREDEFDKTIMSIKEKIFPLLDINDSSDEYIIIGSIGKKANKSDTSGDIDIGYDYKSFAKKHNISSIAETGKIIKDILDANLDEDIDIEVKYLKSLNIVSIGWPIEGDAKNGIVQLDLIPLSDMKWAKFIYYSPNYKLRESKYKSAHRNWLFSAILTQRRKTISKDDDNEILEFDNPVLILSNGLYWHRKTFKGTRVDRLKDAKKIDNSERFITNNPQEFVDFVLGKGYKPSDVKTFEDLFSIISDKDFELYDKISDIKKEYLKFLERVKLEIPQEINKI